VKASWRRRGGGRRGVAWRGMAASIMAAAWRRRKSEKYRGVIRRNKNIENINNEKYLIKMALAANQQRRVSMHISIISSKQWHAQASGIKHAARGMANQASSVSSGSENQRQRKWRQHMALAANGVS